MCPPRPRPAQVTQRGSWASRLLHRPQPRGTRDGTLSPDPQPLPCPRSRPRGWACGTGEGAAPCAARGVLGRAFPDHSRERAPSRPEAAGDRGRALWGKGTGPGGRVWPWRRPPPSDRAQSAAPGVDAGGPRGSAFPRTPRGPGPARPGAPTCPCLCRPGSRGTFLAGCGRGSREHGRTPGARPSPSCSARVLGRPGPLRGASLSLYPAAKAEPARLIPGPRLEPSLAASKGAGVQKPCRGQTPFAVVSVIAGTEFPSSGEKGRRSHPSRCPEWGGETLRVGARGPGARAEAAGAQGAPWSPSTPPPSPLHRFCRSSAGSTRPSGRKRR